MKKKSMWSLNFSTAALVLIPAAVGINYVGKLFAQFLKLPLWLDSIGTILASMLGGPIIGGLSGLINNVVYGLMQDPVSFIYGLTSLAIGITAGALAYKGFLSGWPRAFLIGVAVALVSTVVSTPINVAFWEGTTGNVWGDALFAYVISKTPSIWLASFLDELVVDLPDKIITVLISFALYKGLPKNIRALYDNQNEIEDI